MPECFCNNIDEMSEYVDSVNTSGQPLRNLFFFYISKLLTNLDTAYERKACTFTVGPHNITLDFLVVVKSTGQCFFKTAFSLE